MKKIQLKLTHPDMECFIHVCRQLGSDARCTDLMQAVLLQLWWRIRHRADIKYIQARSVQLTMPEAIALYAAISKVTLNHFEPFALSVITPIYETIQKQLHHP